jgi:hypothetical protein
MTPLTKLLIDVQNGDIDPSELTLEQQEMVLKGYRELAGRLLDDPAFLEAGEQILEIIETVEINDPFEAAIVDAETRGSTYWDLESDSLH